MADTQAKAKSPAKAAGALACAVCALALQVGLGPAARAQQAPQELPFDLRYLGEVQSSNGCYPIFDQLLINPKNVEQNGLAWISSGGSVEIVYAATIQKPTVAVYEAVIQLKIVDYGPAARPRATVQVLAPGGDVVGEGHVAITGGYQLVKVPFRAAGPGTYRAVLRCAGEQCFVGAAAQVCYFAPRRVRPPTREERLAAHGIDEQRTTFVPAESVLGDVRQESDERFFAAHSAGKNALSWSYQGFEEHRFGVRWRFSVEQSAQGPARLGLTLYFPVGTGQLTIDAPDGSRSRHTIYGSPELRTLWFPINLVAGQYVVTLTDERVGRAECAVYSDLMLAR